MVGRANNDNSSQLTTIGKEVFMGVFIGGKGPVEMKFRTMKLRFVGKYAFKGANKKNSHVEIPDSIGGKLINKSAK